MTTAQKRLLDIALVIAAMVAVPVGVALFVLTKHPGIAMALAFPGGFVLYMKWSDKYRGSDRIEHLFLFPHDGGVLVIEDTIVLTGGDMGGFTDQYRLASRRLSDGARLGHLTEVPGLRLLGSTPDFLWCTSKAMPVHTRHPVTLDVIHDDKAIVGTSGVVLKKTSEDDNPSFDPKSRGVHAFGRDGRGYLITPDLQVVETPRSAIHMAPTAKRAYVDGALEITQVLEPEPGWPHPRIGVRPASTAKRPRDLVTVTTTDGKTHWETSFGFGSICRAYYLCASRDRIVFVLGPGKTYTVGSGYRSRTIGGNEGFKAIGLDAANGAIVWQARI